MMKENISLNQLLALIIGFNLGSSVVLGIGLLGKQAAWIVVLFSSFIGLVIVLAYYFMSTFSPDKNLYELMETCIGRPLAVVGSIIYVLYFFYMACRVIRDFIELTSTVILPITPIEVLTLALVLIIGYILYLGVEVLGRTTEIFTPYSVVFIILLAIFLYASKNFSLDKVTPILPDGVKPLIKIIFPYELVRPYGQIIAFTCIFPLVGNFKKGNKVLIFAIALSSFFLTVATLFVSLSLGSNIASRAVFPLLSATRLISIGEFIERIDAFTVFIIMLGILVKSSVFIFAGLKGLEYICHIPYRFFIMPVVCIISLFTVFIGRGITDHVQEGFKVVPFLLNLPLQFLVPVILLVILLGKKATGKLKN
ncbi:endospore germination permease [Niallia taxi]|uniref:GerAB/ArcD/ProY family transporter n=1 Tax=Niallia taxi TaxID=2499688 RepID=UPI002E251CC2|nr:endospore germination permease [Niallia taxi]MED4119661.1 endospore germination permease [Niallia taxi]